jgi:hypothetical protein
MSKGDVFEAALLDLIFLNIDIANIGDAAGLQNSAAAGSLFVALHTADPAEGGSQTSNEVSYTGYARVGVARSGAGWVRTGSTINPAANIDFGECTVGSTTATHFSVGTVVSGAGMVLYKGPLSPTIPIAPGTIPRLTPALAVTED